MTVTAVRQRLRLAPPSTKTYTPTALPWTCRTCRIHAAARAGVSRAPPRNQNGRGRKQHPSETLRYSTASTTPSIAVEPFGRVQSTNFTASDGGSIHALFQTVRRHANELESQKREDKHGLVRALTERDVEALKRALHFASEDISYIRRIPQSTWTEIIRAMAPNRMMVPLHFERHGSFLSGLQVRAGGYDPTKARESYIETLGLVIQIIIQLGVPFGIIDYRILLQYASQIGHAQGARALWADMRRSGLLPDVLCYNAYMEAIVWDEESRLKQKRRSVLPWKRNRPKPTDVVLFRPKPSAAVKGIFNEMLSRRVAGNTATFCVVLTALGRIGELGTVKEIIFNTWGVDVNAFIERADHGVNYRPLRKGSPTYPDQRLLVTIAEVFGAANQTQLSLRLIDYLSKVYEIKISDGAWYQISRWIWLMGRIPKKHQLRPEEGRVRLETVQQVFQIMEAGRRTRPASLSLDQLHVKFSSYGINIGDGRRIDRLLEVFALGKARFEHLWRKSSLALAEYRKARDSAARSTVPSMMPRIPISRWRHSARIAHVKAQVARDLMLRWTRRMVRLRWIKFGPGGVPDEELTAWHRRGVAQFLSKHAKFAPTLVVYHIETGRVELVLRSRKELGQMRRAKASRRAARQVVDV